MTLSAPRFTVIPAATIFVRHSAGCAHQDDPQYKRCNCWKHLRYSVEGVMRYVATKQRSWAGAERAKREFELSHDPTYRASQSAVVSVSDAIATFLQEKQGQNLSASVLGKYGRELDRLLHYLESANVFQLDHVSLPHLTGYRSTWAAEYPSSLTRSKVQERLKGFFRYVTLAYNLPRSPAQGLTAIKVDDCPTMPFEPAEYKAILDAVPQVFPESNPLRMRMLALIQLMRWSALAIRDATCLERGKIQAGADGVTRIITSRAKTKVFVRVPVPPSVAQLLAEVVNGNPKYVFWNGASLPESVAKDYHPAFRLVFDKAGIPDGHPHRLRDTAAVEWLKSGLSLFDVSKLLGHTSVKTTEKHYAPWVQSLQDRLDSNVIATWRA